LRKKGLEKMNPKDVAASFKEKFGGAVSKAEITRVENSGVGGAFVERLWISVERHSFMEAVRHLFGLFEAPHFSVIAGSDLGSAVELNYVFSVGYGKRLEELCIALKVALPKKDLVVPTITGLAPGALVSEREMQEMLGVKVEGIPDPRRLFLPAEFPKGVFPWRRDASGPERLVRNLNKENEK
jgi:membrane-bound hydrogenase subunit beta